jgi:ribose-phosphate pyrophosphokinase
MAVGMPARVIRDAPKKVSKDGEKKQGDRAASKNGGLVRAMYNGHLDRRRRSGWYSSRGAATPSSREDRGQARYFLGRGSISPASRAGEVYARYEQSIRGADVFIVQSLGEPVNQNLMELLVMIDAAKRASAESIVAVIPWLAYSRQDRKTKPREPITARLVASMLRVAGATRVMTMDLHVGQIEGFFSTPWTT